jgi:hypothetical protein
MAKRSKPSAWSEGVRQRISGNFAPRLYEMLRSASYRNLSLAAHRVVSRIEIELAKHGKRVRQFNGRLPITYKQFVEYGVLRRHIAPTLKELEAQGLLRTTQTGCGGNAEFKQMNLYRLTYRPAEGVPGDGSHEWRLVSEDQAKANARQAEQERIASRKASRKHNHSDVLSVTTTVTKNIFPVPPAGTGRVPPAGTRKRDKAWQLTKPSRTSQPPQTTESPAIAANSAIAGKNHVTVVTDDRVPAGGTPSRVWVGSAPPVPSSVTVIRWPAGVEPRASPRRCGCGKQIGLKRQNARFCSPTCRKRAHRALPSPPAGTAPDDTLPPSAPTAAEILNRGRKVQ